MDQQKQAWWRRALAPPEVMRRTLRFNHVLLRYPQYTRQFVSNLRNEQPPEVASEYELAIYETYTQHHYYSAQASVIIHFLLVIKLMLPVVYTMTQVDFNQPEANLKTITSKSDTTPIHRFLCLETNCSQLSTGRHLAEDLIKLPVFAICAPYLSAHVNPLIYTHVFGITALAGVSLFVFVTACCGPIYSLLNPRPSHLILDVMCPRISIQLMAERIRQQLAMLLYSQLNHITNYAPLAQTVYSLEPLYSTTFLPPTFLPTPENSPPFSTHHKHGDELVGTSPNDNSLRQQFAATIAHLQAHPTDLSFLKRFEQPDAPQHVREAVERIKMLLLQPSEAEVYDFRPPSWNRNVDFKRRRRYLEGQKTIVDDCMPPQMSEWFRSNWLLAFVVNTSGVFMGSLGALLVTCVWLSLDQTYINIYHSFAHQMARDSCSMWRRRDDDEFQQETTGTPIDLHNLVPGWTGAQMLEFLLTATIPIYVITVSVAQYYHSMNFFCIMITDLSNQLKIILELAELFKLPARQWRRIDLAALGFVETNSQQISCEAIHETSSRHLKSPMRHIRDRLYELVHPNFLFILPKKRRRLDGRPIDSKLDERLANQEFARHLVSTTSQGEFDMDAYVDLLEKVHLNYWYFMETLKEHYAPVTMCQTFSYVVNYGFALIGLYLFKSFKEFVLLPIILTTMSLIIANGFITFSSNVHAKAKRLELKFWSLIASTAHCNDCRVRHLRHLWIKQLELIDAEGGLALKMFGRINVTYVGIIQYVVWTASILLLAYTRR